MAQESAAGERWTICRSDHVHWGANGGAGLLFRYAPGGIPATYLLTRWSRLVDEGGRWGIPGGAIRDGEAPEAAARRETVEELGYLPLRRITGVKLQDCGGGWQFRIFTGDVDTEFVAYCLHETDATSWFTTQAMLGLQLNSGIRRWLGEEASRAAT